MQRSNHTTGDFQMPSAAPLATPQNTNYFIPTMPNMPGQSLATTATARTMPTIIELINAMKRRLVLAAFLGILVGMAAAAAIWLSLPNGKHRAMAMLEVKSLNEVDFNVKEFNDTETENFRAKQKVLIKSRQLLDRVVADPVIAKLSDIKTSDDPAKYLNENISTDWAAPGLMTVTMRGDDPKAIKQIIDIHLDTFLKDEISEEKKGRQAALSARLLDLDNTQKTINTLEENIKRAMKSSGPGVEFSPEVRRVIVDFQQQELKEIKQSIAKTKDELNKDRIRLEQAKQNLANVTSLEVTEAELEKALAAAGELRERFDQLSVARQKLARTASRSLPNSPALAAEKAELEALEKKIKGEMLALQPKYEQEIRNERKRNLVQDINTITGLIDLNQKYVEKQEEEEVKSKKRLDSNGLNALEVTLTMKDLEPYRDKRTELQRAILNLQNLVSADTRVSRRGLAEVTINQNLNQKVLLAIAAFMAGSLSVMFAVAFLEWRSRRVDSVDQIINDVGLRVIGTIPAFPSKQSLKSGDAAQSQNWRFVLNESVNSARTMLLHTAKTQNMQILMVTSAMQGEGKTSLASQLATSMATAGLRTLILDCDLRNPSMHKLFDAPLTPGCAEVLCQEIDVSDAVQPTTVPNLWLIPAGQCSNRVITALAQGHPLETLFNRLRGQFDFIVVDSCPVLPVADSLLVGQHVDGVVISILQDISQLPKVMTASERLTQLNIPLLGAVVNGIKPDIHAYGYNYVKQLPA
ncbi:MAG: polysaccharide biosynthesis tyrosine autokinase [Fimbriiglobus sp.]